MSISLIPENPIDQIPDRAVTQASALLALEYGERSSGIIYPEAYAAKSAGVSTDAVRDWSRGKKIHPRTVEAKEMLRESILEKAKNLQHMLFDRATQALENENVSFRDLIGGIKIVTDVTQLLSGEATSRVESVSHVRSVVIQGYTHALQLVQSEHGCTEEEAVKYLEENKPHLVKLLREATADDVAA